MAIAAPILMYHSVDRSCAPAYRQWTVTPERFSEQMAVLKDRGRVPVTISQLAEQLQSGHVDEAAVAITFDDGLADFRSGALPILERLGFAATLFVTTGYVGETSRWLAHLGENDRRMLSWEEIAELPGHNVEIGAHTHTHPQLDLLPLDEAQQEIERSKSLLESHLGQPVRSFAYPHGYSTPAVRNLVARGGFVAACRVANGLMWPGESPYALSRLIVTEDWSASRMEDLFDGRLARVAAQPDRLPVKVWRAYRRARSALVGTGGPRLPFSLGR